MISALASSGAACTAHQRPTQPAPADGPTLAAIFRRYGPAFHRAFRGSISTTQERALRELAVCQTAVLGGHRRQCDTCGHLTYHYNSCRNRHCSRCQAGVRRRWRQDRIDELLDVEYFHVVMTLPDELAQLAADNPRVVYSILCLAAAQAILKVGRRWKRLRAHMGIILVLHSWGQVLNRHPHVHLLIPAGGIALDGRRWVYLPRGVFLPEEWLRREFRTIYLQMLGRAYRKGQLTLRRQFAAIREPEAFQAWTDKLAALDWITHARPVGQASDPDGRLRTIGYLARYATGVAMTDRRIVSIDDGQVTFTYKDYRNQDDPAGPAPIKYMTLPAVEFIRRFLQHVLPHGMRHIRGYGFMVPGKRVENLRRIRQMIGMKGDGPERDASAEDDQRQEPDEPLDDRTDQQRCPACGKGTIRLVWSQPRPRVADLMAMTLADLCQIRLTEWDEF